jgi:Rieske Fe-S protein
LLLICRDDITREDLERFDARLTALPDDVRWARRAGRLVVQLPGVAPGDARVEAVEIDPAVDHVLADPTPDEARRIFSRRELLDVALLTSGALVGAAVLGPVGLYLNAPTSQRFQGDVLALPIDAIPIGGAVSRVVDGEDLVIIRRDAEHVSTLSATCTHSDVCLVQWDRDLRQLLCPCHHGVFDVHGNVVSGPPPRPLPARETVVRDGNIYLRRRG